MENRMLISKLLIRNEHSIKDIYIWSTLGSIAIAASSFLLLLAVSRTLGAYEAGIFAIAFALAQQLICIGYFEVRVFQATDIEQEFHFSEYLTLRFFTCGGMILSSCVFALMNLNDLYKASVIILVCFLKCLDAFADVYETMFQQNERLDVAGKSLFIRTTLYTIVFIILLLFFQDLSLALIGAIIVSMVCIFFTNIKIQRIFVRKFIKINKLHIYELLKTCLPLFLCSFLCIYIINAPKYAIDTFMTNEFQTYFSILFFPASVLNLISGFIFKPLLTSIAVLFKEERLKELKGLMYKLFLTMILLTFVILSCAYFLGTPVLSFMYGLDLSNYRNELLVVILGGAVYALSIILYYIMVTARAHMKIMLTYGITALLAFAIVPLFVGKWGLMGASLSYLILMIILFVVSYIMILVIYKKGISSDLNCKIKTIENDTYI